MLKPLTRSFTAIVLLFLFAASSASGAHHPRSVRTRANRHHHARHHLARHRSAGHHAARHRHPRRRSAHRNALVRKASTTAATTLLGDEAVESSKDSLTAGQTEAFPFPARTSGATGAVHVYIDSHDTARTLIVGLYTNLNSHPGALLTTGSLSSPQAGAWNTAAVAPAQLVSGTTYWLAVLGTDGTLRYRDRWHGPCKAETSAQTNLGALATLWSTGGLYSTCPISAYVTSATSTLLEGPPVEVAPIESPLPPAAPANSVLPAISGVATEGQSLIATTGTWTGSPTSYSYQWQDCDSSGASCVNVTGASATTYTLSASDVNHAIRVVVTATNEGGSTAAASAATATVASDPLPLPQPPANTTLPAISGSTVQGQVLSSTNGSWTDNPTSYAYQWQDCNSSGEACSNVSGATSSSYTLGSGDVGNTARVVVTATNAGGSTSASSAATAAAVSPSPPTNIALPAVNGVTTEGDALNAGPGSWTNSPTSYGYQWQDCNNEGSSCTNIGGATASSYTLVHNDVNHRIRIVMIATNAGGSTSAVSPATAIVTEALPAAPSYDQAILDDHPVAFWDMSHPNGSEPDLSGGGHSGSYKGASASLTVLPDGSAAVDFNGSSEYLTVASSPAFSVATTGQLTWEAWIRPDVLQWSKASDPYGYGYVDWMGKCQDYSPTCEWESRMYSSTSTRCSRLSAYVFNLSAGLGSAADWQPECGLLKAGSWLHVVGEYQTLSTPSPCSTTFPGTINIWVNGVEWNQSYHYPTGCMSQYGVTPTASSSPLDIGTMALDTWFAGAVGKVAIYDRLLSQSQISAHFTAMTGIAPSGSCLATCAIAAAAAP
jgi:Concanavalin A-like lectin/glucanases superfamily